MALHYVKRMLGSVGAIATINARLRAWRMFREWHRLSAHYRIRANAARRAHCTDTAQCNVTVQLSPTNLKRAEGRPRVFWIGANWEQDDSGFLTGMARISDVVWAVQRSGSYGFRQSSGDGRHRWLDERVRRENHECLLEQIARAHAQSPLSLVWGQMWANYISPDTLRAVRKMGVPVANVALDDRLPEHWRYYSGMRLGSVGFGDAVDLVLTTAAECVAWYACEGMSAVFWPMASDPTKFAPGAENEKCYDLSFIGNRYGIRDELVGGIKASGIDVAAFGAGWLNGPVTAGQSAKIFARSRVVLGIGTIGHSRNMYTLKLRDFDATMSGALYITHRNHDLLSLFQEDSEIICYTTLSECIKKIRYYLKNPDERLAIAARGRKRALDHHTWDIRIRDAYAAVGILGGQVTSRNAVA